MIGAFVLWAWTRQLAMDPNLLALTNSPFLPGPRNLSTLLRPALWRRIPADHPQSSCSSTPSSGTSLLSARSGFNWRTTLTVRQKKGRERSVDQMGNCWGDLTVIVTVLHHWPFSSFSSQRRRSTSTAVVMKMMKTEAMTESQGILCDFGVGIWRIAEHCSYARSLA